MLNEDEALLYYIQNLNKVGLYYHAIIFTLQDKHFDPKKLLYIRNSLKDDLHHPLDIFLCHDGDITLIFHSKENNKEYYINLVHKELDKINYSELKAHLHYYNLIEDLDKVTSFCQRKIGILNRKKVETIIKEAPRDIIQRNPDIFTPVEHLLYLERQIEINDILPTLNKQAIATPETMVFQEISFEINKLLSLCYSRFPIEKHPLLLRHFNKKLEQKLLNFFLIHQFEYLSKAVVINISIDNLRSDFFTNFDAIVTRETKVIWGISIYDILEHLSIYPEIYQNCQEKGYQIIINHLDQELLNIINLTNLDFHYIKLHFPSLEFNCHIDPKKIIMTHCHNLEELQFGLSHHIPLFQGKIIEEKVNK